uniref:Coronin n=1 Tax=Anopheles atroparvus TaxID=41427 RepID=A0AAG5D1B3_ANOAO
MAWRFKASKYKNAAPSVPKLDMFVRDLIVGSYQTYGNNIAASAAFIAFNWEHQGSSVAVLPLEGNSRKGKAMPLLQSHYDTVSHLDFSPFHDGMLATGSHDCSVKVWHIPEKGLEQTMTTPECSFSTMKRRVETVGFHPTADCLLSGTAMDSVYLWDLTKQQQTFFNEEHPDVIQSLCWKTDGRLCATSCKDKMVRVMDLRASSPITLDAESHQNFIDSRIIWLGDQNRVLTTGFDATRLRQVMIRDLRNFRTPETILPLDASTGILMPLYDADTGMLFLAGKGNTSIAYLEVTDREPQLLEGIRHSGDQTTRGACLVPKRALRVMEGEVNRVMQLTSNAVIPVSYLVPRKSYREFHGDLYPDTTGYTTELTATQWLNGANTVLPKISLDPAKRELGSAPIVILRGPLNELVNNITNSQGHETKNVSLAVTKTREKMKQFEIKAKQEQFELAKKFEEITATCEKIRIVDNALPIDDNGNGKPSSFDSETEKAGDTTAPKPLPRTMSGEEATHGGCVTAIGIYVTNLDNKPRPSPRPRSTGNKPRLGPKPFSVDVASFNVPVAPGSQTAKKDGPENGNHSAGCSSESPEEPDSKLTPGLSDNLPDGGSEPMDQGLLDDSELVQLREKSSDDGNPQILSTAERRMIFEKWTSSESVDKFDGSTTDSEFQRMGTGRSTLADKRRMFEGRSQSVQDEKASPTPPRRRQMTIAPDDQKASDDSGLMPPPAIEPGFPRNRSDLSKENMQHATVKRSNSTSGSTSTDGSQAARTGNSTSATPNSKRHSTVFGRVSKFRHLQGVPGHKRTHIEDILNMCRQVPYECDGFQANAERVAVPIAGTGGKIAVFELANTGRVPEGVIPTFISVQKLMDFQWDPFEPTRLMVAYDDGKVYLWKVPPGGLTETIAEPAATLSAHEEKISLIRFHPLANNVLLTASSDMTMKVWDLATMTQRYCLVGHTDQILTFAWSPCGRFGATVSKDGSIRIYEPRCSENPIREGALPTGTRGARIVWAMEGEYLVITCFDKISERQIYVYNQSNLNTPMHMVGLDVSPAILMPFYDEDSSILFATGKGDSIIYCFEITDEAPYIFPLFHHRCTTMTRGLSFLSKNHCDVASVEFAKAYRLTKSSVEPLGFTAPRVKSELFQDDLFPETKVLWKPTMTADEWFAGKNIQPARISLQPPGMEKMSSVQQSIPPVPPKKIEPIMGIQKSIMNATDHVQEQIKNSVSARMSVNKKLEQDDMEGVDEKEWEE